MTPWCRGRPTIELIVNEIQQCEEYGLREDSSGSIISGETGLAHTGTIVNDLDVSSIDEKEAEQLTSAATSSSLFGQLRFISLHTNSHFDNLF